MGVGRVIRSRLDAIRELIRVLDPDNANESRAETRQAAVYLLGDLRAAEAVPVLARALADEPGPRADSAFNPSMMPVRSALVRMDQKAAPAMIEILETTDGPAYRASALGILDSVVGPRRRLLEMLERRERAADPVRARRLAWARDWVEENYMESKDASAPAPKH